MNECLYPSSCGQLIPGIKNDTYNYFGELLVNDISLVTNVLLGYPYPKFNSLSGCTCINLSLLLVDSFTSNDVNSVP